MAATAGSVLMRGSPLRRRGVDEKQGEERRSVTHGRFGEKVARVGKGSERDSDGSLQPAREKGGQYDATTWWRGRRGEGSRDVVKRWGSGARQQRESDGGGRHGVKQGG
jgi:hypothetical protein